MLQQIRNVIGTPIVFFGLLTLLAGAWVISGKTGARAMFRALDRAVL
jgi:hypothetical protein